MPRSQMKVANTEMQVSVELASGSGVRATSFLLISVPAVQNGL